MTPEEAYELLAPCPFCGKDEARPVVMGEWGPDDTMIDWGVECDCGCLVQSFDGRIQEIEMAVAKWNSRVHGYKRKEV